MDKMMRDSIIISKTAAYSKPRQSGDLSMKIKKKIPFGVLFFIYDRRPSNLATQRFRTNTFYPIGHIVVKIDFLLILLYDIFVGENCMKTFFDYQEIKLTM